MFDAPAARQRRGSCGESLLSWGASGWNGATLACRAVLMKCPCRVDSGRDRGWWLDRTWSELRRLIRARSGWPLVRFSSGVNEGPSPSIASPTPGTVRR